MKTNSQLMFKELTWLSNIQSSIPRTILKNPLSPQLAPCFYEPNSKNKKQKKQNQTKHISLTVCLYPRVLDCPIQGSVLFSVSDNFDRVQSFKPTALVFVHCSRKVCVKVAVDDKGGVERPAQQRSHDRGSVFLRIKEIARMRIIRSSKVPGHWRAICAFLLASTGHAPASCTNNQQLENKKKKGKKARGEGRRVDEEMRLIRIWNEKRTVMNKRKRMTINNQQLNKQEQYENKKKSEKTSEKSWIEEYLTKKWDQDEWGMNW
jgi:hypothetical protein